MLPFLLLPQLHTLGPLPPPPASAACPVKKNWNFFSRLNKVSGKAYSRRTLAYQEVILRIGPLAKLIEAM